MDNFIQLSTESVGQDEYEIAKNCPQRTSVLEARG